MRLWVELLQWLKNTGLTIDEIEAVVSEYLESRETMDHANQLELPLG